jgi:beta-glucanase (GH16 family)
MKSKKRLINLLVIANIVISLFVISSPATSVVAQTGASDSGFLIIADFEGGVPDGFVPFADSWDGSGSSTTLAMTTDTVDLPIVPSTTGNTVIAVTYDIAASGGWGGGPGYGGVTHDFAATQDWSNHQAFSLWFHGSNSGADMRVELKSDGADAATSNRYEYTFTDDVVGWRLFNIPFGDFTRRFDYNPGPSPDDPINLSQMWGYSILLPGGASGTFYLDQVAVTGSATVADFESGVPAGFVPFADSWDGSGSSTTLAMTTATVDLPVIPGTAGNTVIAVTYDIAASGGWGGGPGYGGVTHDFAATQDWSNHQAFSLWFHGSNSGADMRVELKSDGADATNSNRYEYTFTDDVVGWRFLNLPFDSFTRRFDYNPGPSPDDPINLSQMWGYSILLPGGASGTFYLDQVAVFGVPTAEGVIVDDFESGLPVGTDGDGNAIGFFTFQDPGGSTVAISTTDAPPAAVPGKSDPNNVLQVETNVRDGGWAGLVHAFENEALDTWTPQDWSAYEGFSFWLYGNNTGKTLFIDILDNRTPGSTGDTAERFSIDIPDDFTGWRFFEIPFANFSRKEIGNSAPNDGFTLTEVHGWAFGVFSSAQSFTNYIDDVGLYGVGEIPELSVGFSANAYDVIEGDTAVVTVKLNRSMSQEDDPEQVTVTYSTEDGSALSGRDYTPADGTLTFVKGGASAQTFAVSTVDNSKHDGDKTVLLHLADPVGAPLGFISLARIDIEDDEPFDPLLIDDFERFPDLWDASDNVILSNPEIAAGDPLALPGQGAYEGVLSVTAPLRVDIDVKPGDSDGSLCNSGKGVVPVALLTTDDFDATTVDHSTVMLGDAYETHVNKKTGVPQRHVEDVDGDGDADLVFHFRYAETGLPCDPEVVPFNGWTFDGQPITAGGADARFGRGFALDRDWSLSEGLTFWYYGQNTGDTLTVELLDNRAPDPGPDGWSTVWSDEFDNPAGTPPDASNWTPEIGDGTINANPGWGNAELEYYTDSIENAATDGEGNLVITAKQADDSLECYYGPCEYTSARLISWHKAEFAYGRIEARLQVPFGQGMWPAFWTLGTDIGEVGWPQSGELDIMEHIGREPTMVYGTVHGPGYSGGAGVGAGYEHPDGQAFSDDFHVFAVEWEPDEIRWYVDGIQFFAATPDDVSGEWVFDHPFFIILNVAVGGNWPGYPDDTTVFPQTMHVDYVRVYQGPDTAERFESAFVDDFAGWQEVVVPFDSFTRSAKQPEGAPNDGLGLTEVWGYGFHLPYGTRTESLLLDQVRLTAPAAVTVVNTNDSGSGSLRQAIALVANGGTITFDAGLADETITLTSGPLWISGKQVTIDGSTAPGLTVSGGGADRVFIIDPGATANINALVIANGYGWHLAGGILNNGTLNLTGSTVTNNVADTDSFDPNTDFWKGGGGIYNGGGASLSLVDSTVSGNSTTLMDGGGIYGFQGSTANIVNSTLSGNTAGNTGGGMRMLGNASIVNSTISGNEALAWYGGALFLTDGVMDLVNSTIADNVSPLGAPEVIFVGTFGPANATLMLTNSIVANATGGCFIAPWGSGAVDITSGGHNIGSDDTCNLTAPGDMPNIDPMVGPLANNGGPTLTHALLAGSPAIDAGDDSVCPATDQRGVARDAACDIGSYEFVP